MKTQACEPCAKRKVRCDHGDPCSNCKRRKTDNCTYSAVTPQDRIKQLEALVRELGGNPDDKIDGSKSEPVSRRTAYRSPNHTDPEDHLLLTALQSQVQGRHISTPIQAISKDPVVLEEDGQSVYLESNAWRGWLGDDNNENVGHNKSKLSFPSQKRPHALSSVSAGLSSDTIHERYPTTDNANELWDIFMDRVEPLFRMCYRWWLKEFRIRALDSTTCQQFSGAEHAFLSAIYLISVVSMSDEMCQNLLHQSHNEAISQYQHLCEDALLRTNLFCMIDILVIKAAIVYMMSGYDRLSAQSLWVLVGLTIRNAEKLGIHRDGTLLGLSPVRTEERRRVWWQLQGLDLGIAVRTGSTPMTLMADWDSKLPLNIEDDDIDPNSTELPQPRKGLTSMSVSRYSNFVLEQQRTIFRSKQTRFALSWQSNTALPQAMKDSVLTELEDAVNKEFLQYCDPIKPLHIFLQLWARFLNAGMRLRLLHPLAYKNNKGNIDPLQRSAILEVSMQCLQYHNTVQSHPGLKKFHWITKTWAPFHAFMCVLIEAAREGDNEKAQEIWNLLSETYAINDSFWELSEDHKKYQAAELVVTAWKTWKKRFGSSLQLTNPDFAEKLEKELVKQRQKLNLEPALDPSRSQDLPLETALLTPESMGIDGDMNFNLDFQDIDWTFWSGVEGV